MNKNLIELSEKCKTITFNPFRVGGIEELDVVKFANLIIKECMDICDNVEDIYLTENESDKMHHIGLGAGVCRDEISKHFGVENETNSL